MGEAELLRRLSVARRSASTRLPILRRTGLPPSNSQRFDYNASNKEGRGLTGSSQSAASG
jgi:hypothetical protein